jgi:hypothetical protein
MKQSTASILALAASLVVVLALASSASAAITNLEETCSRI